jgi:Copper amine oxidase N-terminal domain./Fibronectin type III domain.
MSILLTLGLLLMLWPGTALMADPGIVSVDNEAGLREAVTEAVYAGCTISIDQDITLTTGDLTIGQNVSLTSENGSTLNAEADKIIIPAGKEATFNGDLKVEGNGDRLVEVAGTFTLAGEASIGGDPSDAVYVPDDASGEINITGGSITGSFYGINLSGISSVVTVSGGEITGTNRGVNLIGSGYSADISGGTIKGQYAVYVGGYVGGTKGTATIRGGTLEGTVFGVSCVDGIADITGGSITGMVATDTNGTLNITSGTTAPSLAEGVFYHDSGNLIGFLGTLPAPVDMELGETEDITLTGVYSEVEYSFGTATDAALGAAIDNDTHTVTLNPTAAGSFTLALTATVLNNQTFNLTVPITVTDTGPGTGPIALWKGDGNAEDSIGNNDGTIIGNVQFVAGKVNQAFSFEGAGQYILLPSSLIQNLDNWTVTTWFKTSSGGVIFGLQNGPRESSPVASWGPFLNVDTNGELNGGLWESVIESSQFVADGDWHQAAISVSFGEDTGDDVTLYLDGEQIGSVAAPSSCPTMPWNQIGTGYTRFWPDAADGWFDFNGQTDECALFDRVLSPTEIGAIYEAENNAVSSPLTITTAGLPDGRVGSSYSAALTASGGTAPYTWSATGLPAGLSISAAGVISGTPTAAGTSSVAATVYDSNDDSVSTSYSLVVKQASSGGGGGGGGGITVTAPSVVTASASSITAESAVLNGEISARGGSAITGYGFSYSTDEEQWTEVEAGSDNLLGDFSYTLDGLSPNTAYYFKAYATNSAGTSYGAVQRFLVLEKQAPKTPAAQTVLRFYIGQNGYYVNDQVQTMDTAPVILGGRTMLPVRFMAEALGAVVSWDENERKVTVVLNDQTIELWIGQNLARVNGVETPIDASNPEVKPYISDSGRTMLPLRFIAQTLGCQVDWDPATQEVRVTYPA